MSEFLRSCSSRFPFSKQAWEISRPWKVWGCSWINEMFIKDRSRGVTGAKGQIVIFIVKIITVISTCVEGRWLHDF